ncbi:hypothetical protein P0136_07580 [Lentisphaerota bacterium ZTH]|nr:hypothetical protein JYG24_01305 [Lentisphaerota bacterium]WET05230.1 hypothetical protein P0136_07580 [Lentisphaerota bacterium ZTH]
MKPGDKAKCPHCAEETILKEKVEMDGWQATARSLVCAICGRKIADLDKELEQQKDQEATTTKAGSLAALLGEDPEQPKPKLKAEAGERHFCRDCIHYLVHPFLSRCEKKKKAVNPMDDCRDFKKVERKTEKDNSDSEK